MKYLFGGIIGIGILLIVVFGYCKFLLSEEYCRNKMFSKYFPPTYSFKMNNSRLDSVSVVEIKLGLAKTDEQIVSINKRIDDFYIFAGIIITLLLAINIAVYVNAEKEVEKHMTANYKTYQKQITDYVKQAQIAVGKIQAELELAKSITQIISKEQPNESYDNSEPQA